MTLHISFTDFWSGHDPHNNLITNVLRDIYHTDILCVPDPREADICFVTIYGKSHQLVLDKYASKCILWLGENVRPNRYPCAFSISSDFPSYGGKNFRLPLWMAEIDWYYTDLGIIKPHDL